MGGTGDRVPRDLNVITFLFPPPFCVFLFSDSHFSDCRPKAAASSQVKTFARAAGGGVGARERGRVRVGN